MSTSNQQADRYRINNATPTGERPVSTLARALINCNGVVLFDTEALSRGDAAALAVTQNLLGITASTGDVAGPSSSAANAVARFNGVTGKALKSSAATVDDSGNLACGNVTFTSDNVSSIGTPTNRPKMVYVFDSLRIGSAMSCLYVNKAINGPGGIGHSDAQDLIFWTDDTDRWKITADDGHFVPMDDNTVSIGGIGNRPRGIELGSDGIVLKSPNNVRYRVTVANGGTLSVAPV